MRGEAGRTLLELVAALAVVVLMGGGAIVSLVTMLGDSGSQTFLQRQGRLIMEDLGREIRQASSLHIVNAGSPPGTCMDAITDMRAGTDALMVSNSGGTYCFYLSANSRLVRCAFAGGGCASAKLPEGSLVLPATAGWTVRLLTPCELAGSTCSAEGCADPSGSCGAAPAVRISFSLSDGQDGAMPFVITLAASRQL